MIPFDFLDEATAHRELVAMGYEVEIQDDEGKTVYVKPAPDAPDVDHLDVVMTVTGVDANGEANAWKPRAGGRWLANVNAPAEEPVAKRRDDGQSRAVANPTMRPVDPDIVSFWKGTDQVPIIEATDTTRVVEITTAPVRVFM